MPSASEVSSVASPDSDHSGVKVVAGVPVANVASLVASELLVTTRYSTRSSRSTRLKASTPAPSAAKRGSWAPERRASC